MITYLSQLYKYDINNKFQNKIQDLLYRNKIYGGGDTSVTDKKEEILKHKSTDNAVKTILSDQIIKGLEKNINKINDLIQKSDEADKSDIKLKEEYGIYSFIPTGIPNNSEAIFTTYDDYEKTNIFNAKSSKLTSLSMESDENKQGNPTTLTILGQLKSKKEDIIKIDKDIRTDLNKFLEVPIDDIGNPLTSIEKGGGKYIK